MFKTLVSRTGTRWLPRSLRQPRCSVSRAAQAETKVRIWLGTSRLHLLEWPGILHGRYRHWLSCNEGRLAGRSSRFQFRSRHRLLAALLSLSRPQERPLVYCARRRAQPDISPTGAADTLRKRKTVPVGGLPVHGFSTSIWIGPSALAVDELLDIRRCRWCRWSWPGPARRSRPCGSWRCRRRSCGPRPCRG